MNISSSSRPIFSSKSPSPSTYPSQHNFASLIFFFFHQFPLLKDFFPIQAESILHAVSFVGHWDWISVQRITSSTCPLSDSIYCGFPATASTKLPYKRRNKALPDSKLYVFLFLQLYKYKYGYFYVSSLSGWKRWSSIEWELLMNVYIYGFTIIYVR